MLGPQDIVSVLHLLGKTRFLEHPSVEDVSELAPVIKNALQDDRKYTFVVD